MREFITVSGMRCEVEPIRRTRFEKDIGNPIANVIAPDGYVFSGGETALSVFAAKDFDDIERMESLASEDDRDNG